jgi:hypothetical protein
MPKKYRLFVPVSIIVVLSLFVGGCGPQDRGLSQPSTAVTTTPRGITGIIKTGKTVAASSVNVAAGGGTIAVTKPGDPLDGLIIKIPPNSYTAPKQFKLSYAPVESHTFGANFNPVTPMISVDNGGGYSDEIILVKIPVKVPDGDFAMGFFYNDTTGKLEGMPTVSQDAESITISTRHFSSLLVSTIAKTKLAGSIDSGFKPGVDDWEFPNYGSFINNGHCGGQSMAAMWYYSTQPDGKGVKLYGRYDNNGSSPATPNLWQDDSLGYRFCSVIQTDIDWSNISRKISENYLYQSDEATFMAFSFAMMMTGEPQMVETWDTTNGGGHALVVYRIDSGHLYVADPNYPGVTTRSIDIAAGKFKPYYSGDTADVSDKSYNKVFYDAKTAIIDWGKIPQRWAEFKDKTIGNDMFPAYKLMVYQDNKGNELKDGIVLSNSYFDVGVEFADTPVRGIAGLFPEGATSQHFGITLNPGNNKIGFYVSRGSSKNGYIDFQYLNIVYGGLTLKPATQEAWPGKTITFDLELTEAAPKGAKFEWWVDGVLKKSGYDFGIDVSFPDIGTHTIAVKLVDIAGKVLMQAQGTAIIKALTTTAFVGNNLTALQKMKTFTGVFQGQCNIKEQTAPVYFSVSMWDWYGVNTPLNINWSGASFSGTATSPVDGGTQTSSVSGTVSGDGKTLTSLFFTYNRNSNYTNTAAGISYVVITDNTINVQFKNIPIYDLVFESGSSSNCDLVTYGTEVRSYLVKYEQHFLTVNSGRVTSERTYLSDTINWNGTGLQDTPVIGIHFK